MNKFIIGLILGIVIAGGLSYYLNNMPTKFINKVNNDQLSGITNGNSSEPIILAPGTRLQQARSYDGIPQQQNPSSNTMPNNASEDNDSASEPSYDFYDVLQGKKSAKVDSNSQSQTSKIVRNYLQVGIFDSEDLANNMKARLALMGIDSTIKSQQEKGKIINQILIGPFNNENDLNDVMARLNENNIRAELITLNK